MAVYYSYALTLGVLSIRLPLHRRQLWLACSYKTSKIVGLGWSDYIFATDAFTRV